MTKAELVQKVCAGTTHTTLTRAAARDIVDLVFATMTEAIQSDEAFRVPGFGTFTLRKRAARRGRHPQTGKALRIKASRTVTFRPATALKQAVAKPPRRKASPR